MSLSPAKPETSMFAKCVDMDMARPDPCRCIQMHYWTLPPAGFLSDVVALAHRSHGADSVGRKESKNCPYSSTILESFDLK